ncbi:MAG: acetyl-CoA C-acyltransferase [Pseudomonadales bacterium]|nr:acetyl-CoA C-acyltransferase [Gammaproteobacteria bacterium]NNL57028.1 acetyl-CoA C-acyltransferase [Pseudomonadales bacterium]
MQPVFIYEAVRTPRGRARPDGCLHELTPFSLLSSLYGALQQRLHFDPASIDDVILGCVTQVGEQAANIAKTSVLYHGWPDAVPGITVNRYCSSGLDAMQMAAMKIMTGNSELVIAGGVEMMSRVAMLSDNPLPFTDAALAKKLGMYLMGYGADFIATELGISREQADAVALQSQQRAAHARASGHFTSIVPLHNPLTGNVVKQDDTIRAQTTAASLAALPASFAGNGEVDATLLQSLPDCSHINHIHTAGNSPAMADGASAMLLGSAKLGEKLGLKPRARIQAMVAVNDDPQAVVAGCVAATHTLLSRQGMSVNDIDLFEVHEAFAAVMVKCQRALGIDDSKLNVNGGCIALGHPMGATGGILVGTLLDEMERRGLQNGVAASSGAAGAGAAVLLERVIV